MKNRVAIAACLILLGFSKMLWATSIDDAQQLVERYHLALQSGDTQTILNLFGPEELQLHGYLKEPRYQSLLAKEYHSSTLQILHKEQNGIFYIIDYVIQLDPVGTISERVLVKEITEGEGSQLKIFRKTPL